MRRRQPCMQRNEARLRTGADEDEDEPEDDRSGHAAVALGLFALYSATGEHRWYEAAVDLTSELPRRFADPEGGFFDTPSDGEDLIKRPKSQTDNPLPSGNGLAAEATLVYSAYTGDPDLRDQAAVTLRAAGLFMERYPSMVGHHLGVLHSLLTGRQLAIVGPGLYPTMPTGRRAC